MDTEAIFTDSLDGVSRLTAAAEQARRVEAAVIWLHGLGADGHDFEPLVPVLHECSRLAIRFIFPHAPVRAVTINAGMRMLAWYDIRNIDLGGDRDLDRDGMRDSCRRVAALLDRVLEAHALSPRRIVLAGFSQGGVIALQTGLARPGLAGLIGLSCYLPEIPRSPAVKQLPVFMAHGRDDPMVPCRLGKQAARQLSELGLNVTWRTWPGGHGVMPDEIIALDRWLAAVLTRT